MFIAKFETPKIRSNTVLSYQLTIA